MYFQTLVKSAGRYIGAALYAGRRHHAGIYISEGFAALVGMTVKETEELYREDSFAGVHPEDVESIRKELEELRSSGEEHCRFRSASDEATGATCG